jgi:hypothetical protein
MVDGSLMDKVLKSENNIRIRFIINIPKDHTKRHFLEYTMVDISNFKKEKLASKHRSEYKK